MGLPVRAVFTSSTRPFLAGGACPRSAACALSASSLASNTSRVPGGPARAATRACVLASGGAALADWPSAEGRAAALLRPGCGAVVGPRAAAALVGAPGATAFGGGADRAGGADD